MPVSSARPIDVALLSSPFFAHRTAGCGSRWGTFRSSFYSKCLDSSELSIPALRPGTAGGHAGRAGIPLVTAWRYVKS